MWLADVKERWKLFHEFVNELRDSLHSVVSKAAFFDTTIVDDLSLMDDGIKLSKEKLFHHP
jgi:hypothetical protein